MLVRVLSSDLYFKKMKLSISILQKYNSTTPNLLVYWKAIIEAGNSEISIIRISRDHEYWKIGKLQPILCISLQISKSISPHFGLFKMKSVSILLSHCISCILSILFYPVLFTITIWYNSCIFLPIFNTICNEVYGSPE